MTEREYCQAAADAFYRSDVLAADWILRERDQARRDVEARYCELLAAARAVIEFIPLPVEHRAAKVFRSLRACIARFTN